VIRQGFDLQGVDALSRWAVIGCAWGTPSSGVWLAGLVASAGDGLCLVAGGGLCSSSYQAAYFLFVVSWRRFLEKTQ
jgi:hypothetical protein